MNRTLQLDKHLTRLEHATVYAWLGAIALLMIIAILRAFLPSGMDNFIGTIQHFILDFMIAAMVGFGCLYVIRCFLTPNRPKLPR